MHKQAAMFMYLYTQRQSPLLRSHVPTVFKAKFCNVNHYFPQTQCYNWVLCSKITKNDLEITNFLP